MIKGKLILSSLRTINILKGGVAENATPLTILYINKV
jgi:hypothetical protein